MSILIKGMEMPKSCFYCPFRRKINPDDIQCLVTRDVFEETFAGTIEMRKRGFCPLIEVPLHGRLGDLDALIEKVIAKYLEHERKGELVFAAAEIKQDIVDLISDAPAVIPADKDGET